MRTDVEAAGKYLQPWILLLTLEKRRYRPPPLSESDACLIALPVLHRAVDVMHPPVHFRSVPFPFGILWWRFCTRTTRV